MEAPIPFPFSPFKLKMFFTGVLFLLGPAFVSAANWPAPQGHVNDFAHVVSAGEAASIESLLTQLEQKTGSQVAVVTVPSVEGGDVDGAAVNLFKNWGIGRKGKDDGVLILASLQDRHMRIEVGYGLESILPDGKAGEIIRGYITPSFKQGKYGEGLLFGASAVARIIADNAGVVLDGLQNVPPPRNSGLSDFVRFLFWGSLFLLFLYVRITSGFTRGRSRWGGGFYGGGWGGGNGGSFGSGGFGGFGGGGSGGGGASGGW
jgi:uncharacterized protein